MTTTPEHEHEDLDARLSRIAVDLHGFTPERTIERIAETTRIMLAADGAGVLVTRARGRTETAAATHETVRRAHALQVELDEGPCLDSSVDDGARRIDDTSLDPRWPRWNGKAARLGFRSVLSAPLVTGRRHYGSINAYSARPEAFDGVDEDVIELLARHASVALAAATDIEGLQRAVDGRQVIGMAIGMLMERYHLDADRAFEVLKRYSQHHNVKLHEVAQRLVDDRRLPTEDDDS